MMRSAGTDKVHLTRRQAVADGQAQARRLIGVDMPTEKEIKQEYLKGK